jgi:hypothetical protein
MFKQLSRVLVISVIASATLLACACATVSITYRDPRTFPARTPDAVAVLSERPQRPHLVIASFRLRTGGQAMTPDEITARIRLEAARLGGEAVFIYAHENAGLLVTPGLLLGASSTAREEQRFADVVVFPDASLHPPGEKH